MLDLSHLPTPLADGNIQLFRALGSTDWQSWRKPRGAKLIYMVCLGAGAGGGGGFSGAAGSARGGGGGGGSGAIAQLIIPSVALPDELFVYVGLGGAGGIAGVPGGAGGNTLVSCQTNTARGSIILSANTANAIRGSAGTATTGGAGGSAASAGIRYPLNGFGIFSALAGVAGSAGGAHTGAAGGDLMGTQIVCGGLGGGGVGTADTDFAGGAYADPGGIVPSLPGGAATDDGSNGFEARSIGMSVPIGFVGVPGTGGGTSGTAGTAGKGGNGGLGCGGGGGGGGVTGGAGGRGGDGICVIMAI